MHGHQDEKPSPPRRGLKKGLYLIPSAFTAANIAMGYYALMGALRGFQLLQSGTETDLARAAVHFANAGRAIGWAILFDILDGRIARMTKTTTEIGVQLDSIADVVTFGIAPAILVYVWSYGAALVEGSPLHRLGWFCSFVYLICAAFRLARFNVQATRPRPLAEGTVKLDKKSFIGLPTPPAAGVIAALVSFAPLAIISATHERAEIYSLLIMALIIALAFLMVSTFRYTSFKGVGITRRSARFFILAVATGGMLIFLYSRYVLLTLVTAYVLHGPLFRLAGLFRRRKPETT
ncbi:MAG: CDP-diacylglycerol--serine O-phosphatidyltransferase [Pyrinomonadaceae bacterium]